MISRYTDCQRLAKTYCLLLSAEKSVSQTHDELMALAYDLVFARAPDPKDWIDNFRVNRAKQMAINVSFNSFKI